MTTTGKTAPRKAGIVWILLLGAAGLVCVLLLVAYARPLSSQIADFSIEGEDLGGWEVYIVRDGVHIPLDSTRPGSFYGLDYPGQTFYASRVLNEDFEEAILELSGPAPVSIFLDDDLVYSEDSEAGTMLYDLVFPGIPSEHMQSFFVSLPPDYRGKTLTIAQAQPASEKQEDDGSVYLGPVILYSKSALISVYSSQNAGTFMLGASLLVAGVVLAALFVMSVFRQSPDYGILALALFLFVSSAEETLQSSLAFYYYGQDASRFQEYLRWIAFLLLALFMWTQMRKCHKWYLPFIVVQAVSICLEIAVDYSTEQTLFLYVSELCQTVTLVSMVAACIFAAIEAHYESPSYRLFMRLLGVAGAVLGGVYIGSALTDGRFASEFNDSMAFAFQMGYFVYPLHILRYALTAICFALAIWAFIRSLVAQNVQRRLAEEKNRMTKASYDQLRSHMYQTMRLRHDMKKHLAVVDLYLQDGDSASAHAYLREMNGSIERVAHVAATGNELVDIVLSSKLAQAEQLGIATKIAFAELPAALGISDQELSALLMNSLDNAITAAEAVTDSWIDVEIRVKNGFFWYTIENSADPDVSESIDSEDDLPEHGYGFSIMEEITENHLGLLQVQRTSGTFRLTIALPIRDLKESPADAS